jgi:hypothetical protein
MQKKMMIKIWTAQRSPRARPWFHEFAPYEVTDQEDHLHDDDYNDD